MTPPDDSNAAQLAKELEYYRREYNELGARVLRLQDEQSQAFREARRSRTVARLIREAYLLVDRAATPEEIGKLMLEVVVDHSMCERAAILRRLPGDEHFMVTHALGFCDGPAPVSLTVPSPPAFDFTTIDTPLEGMALALTDILRVPFILWAFDQNSGYAMLIGNRSQGNVVRPFEAADKELIEGALSVYIDIVVLKQAEVELRAAKLGAEEAGRSKSAFLATLSHELRTPLNAILGFSEILTSDIADVLDKEKFKEYARDIHASGVYLLGLISDILDYSSLENDTLTLHEERTDLIDLVIDATKSLKALSDKKNIDVSVKVLDHMPSVMIDAMRIRQVLINLLGNAIKFSDDGGRIIVTARIAPADGSLLIDVEDDGIGMSDGDIERVFEPFVQAGKSESNPVPGTGLGLPISRALMEAHGGTLTLSSEAGKGTVATMMLPQSRADSGAALAG